jgi:hypothetical protein
VHGEFGSFCFRTSASSRNHNITAAADISVTNGSRYYLRARIRVTLNNASIVFRNNNTALSPAIASGSVSNNVWHLLDGI